MLRHRLRRMYYGKKGRKKVNLPCIFNLRVLSYLDVETSDGMCYLYYDNNSVIISFLYLVGFPVISQHFHGELLFISICVGIH